MQKIKKGDNVKILLGKDNGKSGTVDRVLSKEGRVVIPGLNMFKRHVRKQGDQIGGIIEITKSINISNVVLICPNCEKPTRVGFSIKGKEKMSGAPLRVRICKKCKKEIK